MTKPILEVAVRRGVAANLDKYDLYSDGFVDCSPIVMFNKTNHRCGLFHFYAGHIKEQETILKAMADDVMPTLIYIYKGERVNDKKPPEERRKADGSR